MKKNTSTQFKDSLTSREVDVLTLIAAGRSDKAIADGLGLSYNTVKWYVRQIFNKLGVNRRAQAVAAVRSTGMLDIPIESESRVFGRSLTYREVEVLVLIDAGSSNNTIAEKLGISYNTVAWYVRQIFKKLNVSGRTQAVAVARSLGMLDGARAVEFPSKKHSLPVQSPAFIGRDVELDEIRAKLAEAECRLLTLLGPGGSGKTRLAVEVAGQFFKNFKHGVFFVNLAPVQEADNIPSAIAATVKFSFYGEGTPEEQLLGYLRNKELLLILDNFEHLLAGVCFVNEIIHTGPGVKILVTSRTSLTVTEEHIYPVMGMSYPDMPALIKTVSEQYSAVRLFESGARRRQPTFELTEQNIFDVVQICALVKGMPLGVILAASWVTMLTPGEIAEELARDLDILESELQDLPSRQRSMRSVFTYSWRLLSKDEVIILSALSVFHGGFTREAAQKVTDASLGDLKRLIDQSMLQVTPNGRYELHELLRQFAAEKLWMDPEFETEIREKHSVTYCQSLIEWELALQGAQQVVAHKEMVLEIDNIRAAWNWAVEKLRLNLLLEGINGLCIFYDRNRQRVEGEAICQSLVDRLDGIYTFDKSELYFQDDACRAGIDGLILQARALAWGGFLNMRLGNVDRSHKLLEICLAMLERRELANQDTRFEIAVAYLTLPSVMKNVPRADTIQLAEEAVRLFRSLDEPWWVGFALYSLGNQDESIEKVYRYYDESLAVRRALGDLRGMVDSLESGSYSMAASFLFEKAEAMLSEALAISMELDDHLKIVSISATLGWQWVWQGRFAEARTLYQETLVSYGNLDYTQSFAFIIYAHTGYPDLYLGEYEGSCSKAQHAIELSKELKSYLANFWHALCLDILGKAALAEGSFTEAERYFQECLQLFQTYVIQEKIGTTLACLGYTARETKQIPQAQGYFLEALQIAVEGGEFLSLIHALPGIALLFADQGDNERAVELYAQASTMGIVYNSKWFADIAGDEIEAVAAGLPIEAAKGRVQAPVSWEMAAELLVELGEHGWEGPVLQYVS